MPATSRKQQKWAYAQLSKPASQRPKGMSEEELRHFTQMKGGHKPMHPKTHKAMHGKGK